jgi:hypothetical protein
VERVGGGEWRGAGCVVHQGGEEQLGYAVGSCGVEGRGEEKGEKRGCHGMVWYARLVTSRKRLIAASLLLAHQK